MMAPMKPSREHILGPAALSHSCQLDFADVAYGDATVVENGCGVCVMADVTGTAPASVARLWGTSHWGDDLGTLPAAFDQAETELGHAFSRIDPATFVQTINQDIVLLIDSGNGLHYERLCVRPSYAVELDPRMRHETPVTPCAVRRLVRTARAAWLYEGKVTPS